MPSADPRTWPESLDALVAAAPHHTLLLENDSVRVLDARILPGERTALHTHRWPSVHHIVAMSAFIRRDENDNVILDTRTLPAATFASGIAWSGPLGPHTLENVGSVELHVISVEVKNT
ncbi:MAG: hypothetical protein JWM32_1480 [Verrucomicrobia bacterium]|nr:hypothetical protein [Verrucomicrobiota bacterium]